MRIVVLMTTDAQRPVKISPVLARRGVWMSGMKYVVSRGSVVARDVALRRNRSGLP